jgi:LysR family transcriptional regulator, glycine cleavage system transcriptional activator
MARRLPSLNALKAFEAAARHESFTVAAVELFVTHAAISRHIRELEEYLGTDLFSRTGRGVTLTEAGRRFGVRLTPLFDNLAEAAREAAAVGTARTLKVTVEPSLASRWLVPRLGSFSQQHPDIELTIDPSNRLVDFHAEDFELGIRYGRGAWEDVDAVKLSDVAIFPVCAPKLLATNPLTSAVDLENFTLLHENRKQFWDEWLAMAGVASTQGWRGVTFQNHLAVEAAESGQGFALGDQILCTDSLVDGWLARPLALDMKDHGSYWIVRKKGSKESAPARAFREWLMGEMVETNRKYQVLRGKDAKPQPKPQQTADG